MTNSDHFWTMSLSWKSFFFKDALASHELGLSFLPSLVPSEFLKKDNKTKRKKDKKTKRQKEKRKKEKKTERQKDKTSKRQKDKKTERQKIEKDKKYKIIVSGVIFYEICNHEILQFWCSISWILQPWDLGFWASHNLWIWDIATNPQLWDFGLIHSINKINKGIPINS